MYGEILTYPLSERQVRDELRHFVEFFSDRGVTTCRVLFGYAWGIEYYPGNEWYEESVVLVDLPEKVGEVEAMGLGALGRDDLFVTVSGMEFRFCHESDVHIYFAERHPEVEFFFRRWKLLGYNPAERLDNGDNGPGRNISDA